MQQQRGPQSGETRNMILAVLLSMAVLFGFQFFFFEPQREAQQKDRQIAAQQAQEAEREQVVIVPPTQALERTRAERIVIDTPSVDGSILLVGARFDDLNLKRYRETIAPDSPEVRLLAPRNSTSAAEAFFGWELNNAHTPVALADTQSVWTAPEGARLTPETPVTLTLAGANGVAIERRISVDADFMFTIADTVRNGGAAAVEVRPFGVVRRENLPFDHDLYPGLKQGLSGVFGPEHLLRDATYNSARDHAREKDRGNKGRDERILEMSGQGGWMGLSDHYWLTALVPDQNTQIDAWFDASTRAQQTDYRSAYRGAAWTTLAPGAETTYTQHLFSGAKNVDILRAYQTELGVPDFDKAVDWGLFWFLTRPFFDLMHFFGKLVGNFGFGILLTTIVVKLFLFPLVYQSNVAMTKMRKLAPKMKEIQERYANDKQRQQQEQIRLFQTEKVNPLAGCLPILLQIPVFFALYNVLTTTIEMRHAPFVLWIKDLSARDPTNIFNLFGLLPFDPTHIPVIGGFLWLGVLPILYGVSMYALQALSPPPTDKTQAAIFKWLPWVFMLLFAGFAAGMVIYWVWSNTLSIIQQYVIMRRMGVETEFDKWLAKRFGKDAQAAAK